MLLLVRSRHVLLSNLFPWSDSGGGGGSGASGSSVRSSAGVGAGGGGVGVPVLRFIHSGVKVLETVVSLV